MYFCNKPRISATNPVFLQQIPYFCNKHRISATSTVFLQQASYFCNKHRISATSTLFLSQTQQISWELPKIFGIKLQQHLNHTNSRRLATRLHWKLLPQRWRARGDVRLLLTAKCNKKAENMSNIVFVEMCWSSVP